MRQIEPHIAVAIGVAGGFTLSALLIVIMIATGQTFGQRCAAVGFEWGTPLHAECVRLLNEGKEIRAGRTNNTPDDKEGG